MNLWPKTNSKNSACPWKFFKGRIIWGGGQSLWASMVAQMVKNLPALWKTWVQSLGWEDPLEREWLPTLVFLPGEFHGQRSLAGYSPWGRKESDTTERLSLSEYHLPLCADFLLVGWCLSTKVVFQEACAQPKVSILHVGGGLSSYRRTQRYCYI